MREADKFSGSKCLRLESISFRFLRRWICGEVAFETANEIP